jgi:hypothetical protein
LERRVDDAKNSPIKNILRKRNFSAVFPGAFLPDRRKKLFAFSAKFGICRIQRHAVGAITEALSPFVDPLGNQHQPPNGDGDPKGIERDKSGCLSEKMGVESDDPYAQKGDGCTDNPELFIASNIVFVTFFIRHGTFFFRYEAWEGIMGIKQSI